MNAVLNPSLVIVMIAGAANNSLAERFQDFKSAEKLLILAISFLLFLCPLYFGLNFGQNAVELSPLDIYSWINNASWPLQILAISSLLCLSGALITYPQRLKSEFKYFPIFVPWLFVLIALFPGGINTTEKTFLHSYVTHIIAVFSLSSAVWITVNHRPRTRMIFLGAVFCGACKSIYNGLKQYFYGFNQNLKAIEESAALESSDFNGRAEQTLLYADFVLSNSYAAHLILISGVFLFILRHILRSFNAFPNRIYFWLFISATPFFFCLIATRSRGAFLAIVLSLMITLICGLRKNIRTPMFVALGLIIIGVWYFVRTVPSVVIRKEYARVGWQMFLGEPFGSGMGEFRNAYLLHKIPGIEGTVLPHNLSTTWISQCGISGLILLVFFVAIFVYLGRKLERGNWCFNHFLFFGLLAWFIHAHLDFNFFIPGSVVTFGVLLALFDFKGQSEQKVKLGLGLTASINIAIFCVCCSVFIFIKDMYSLHRFSLTHDRFFGSALVDYRFAGFKNKNLENCDYCLEELNQDDLGYCLNCGVLGDPAFLSSEKIVNESNILEELTSTPDVWKMASRKLSLMYFAQLKRRDDGDSVDPIATEQYLSDSEFAMSRVIEIEPMYGPNYFTLAEIQARRGRKPEEVVKTIQKGLKLSPDSRRGHNLIFRFCQQYESMDLDFRREVFLSHLKMSEIALFPLRMALMEGRAYNQNELNILENVSGQLRQTDKIKSVFITDSEVIEKFEKIKTLLVQLKERV